MTPHDAMAAWEAATVSYLDARAASDAARRAWFLTLADRSGFYGYANPVAPADVDAAHSRSVLAYTACQRARAAACDAYVDAGVPMAARLLAQLSPRGVFVAGGPGHIEALIDALLADPVRT